MEYEITQEDIDFVSNFHEASKLVIEAYDQLEKIEEQGNYGTDSYFQAKKDLEVAINLEDELSYEIESDFDRSLAIMFYIDQKLGIEPNDRQDFQLLLNLYISSTESKIARSALRMRNKLFDFVKDMMEKSNQEDSFKENMDLGLYESLDYFTRQSICKKAVLLENFFNDIVRLMVSLTCDSDPKYGIKLKYLLSSLLKMLEEDNLENNFLVNPHPYVYSKFIGQCMGYSNSELNDELTLLGNQLAKGAIDVIALKILNRESVFYNLLILRSVNILLGEKNLEILEEELLFEDSENEQANEEAVDLITDAFEQYEQDKNKPQVITLARKLS